MYFTNQEVQPWKRKEIKDCYSCMSELNTADWTPPQRGDRVHSKACAFTDLT